MKKILITVSLLALVAMAMAANPRGFWWELQLEDADIMQYVDSQDYDTNSTGWLVEAACSAEPGFVQSTATHHNYLIKVFEPADGLQGLAFVYVDQQRWAEDWAPGDTLTVTLTWLPTGKSVSNGYIIHNLYEDIWMTDYLEMGTPWVLPADLFVADITEE